MPLFPPDDQYPQRERAAWRKHVADKLRADTPDFPEDATDDEIIESDFGALAQETGEPLSLAEHEQVLKNLYGADYVKPERSIREAVGPIAHGVGNAVAALQDPRKMAAAGEIVVRPIVEGFTAPIEAAQSFLTGRALEKTAENMPVPNVEALRAKGYDEQAIRDIITGYADTQKSIMGDVGDVAKKGIGQIAEGAGTYATLPIGGGGGKGLTKLAEKTGIPLVKKLAGSVVGSVARHAATGALAGAGYGLAKDGFTAAAEAADEGRGSGEQFDAFFQKGLPAAAQMGTAGAILGGLLGPGIENLAGAGARRAAEVAAGTRAATRKAALDSFADSFEPGWFNSRFGVDLTQPDDVIVRDIVQRIKGEADPEMEQILMAKLAAFRAQGPAAKGVGVAPYPEVSLPPSQGAVEGLTRGPLHIAEEGGLAPRVTPPALAGPSTQFVPEGAPLAPPENVAPLPDLEPTGVPAPLPPDQLPLTPRAEPPDAVMPPPEGRVGPPLALEDSAGRPIPEAPEPRPLSLEPAPAAPGGERVLTNPPKLGVPEAPAIEPNARVIGPAERAAMDMRALGVPLSSSPTDISRRAGRVEFRVKPLESGKGVELEHLQNMGNGRGDGQKLLTSLTEVADAQEVPIELTALPLPQPGERGTIPLPKLKRFYQKHGFRVVSEEGNSIRMRREPGALPVLPDAVAKEMLDRPAEAFTLAGEALGKTTEELKALADAGKFRPMTDAGAVGNLLVKKDGTVWEYIDPVGPSYNTTRVFGLFRKEKAAELLKRVDERKVVSGEEFVQKFRNPAKAE